MRNASITPTVSKSQHSVSSGFTLIEALVAVTILMIALIGFLDLIVAAQQTSKKGTDYAIAGHVASDQIARFQAADFASLTNGVSNYNLSGLPNGHMNVTIGPPSFSGGSMHIKQADVIVTWSSSTTAAATPSAGTVAMSTLLSETR